MTHQQLRAQCWLQTAASVAGALMCKTPEVAANWADKVLEEFDKRFVEQSTSKDFIETDKFIIKSKT